MSNFLGLILKQQEAVDASPLLRIGNTFVKLKNQLYRSNCIFKPHDTFLIKV